MKSSYPLRGDGDVRGDLQHEVNKLMKPIFEKERLAWMALSVVLLFVCLNVTVRSRREVKKVEIRVARLEQQLAQAKDHIKSARAAFLSDSEYLDLVRDSGLEDPVTYLAADLQKHPELIPFEPAPGSVVHFSHPDATRILSGQWVIADCDNGQFGGKLLLQYSFSEKGKIKWEVIDSCFY